MDKKKLIFIVDDDPFVNNLIARRLESEGYMIEAFCYGEDCLDVLNNGPDLIILDYFFLKEGHNVMDGIEIFNRIKDLMPDTPVIVLSAQEKGEVLLEFARRGIDDYVIKDANLVENLSAAIKNVFERIS